jgi:hypothetical protein
VEVKKEVYLCGSGKVVIQCYIDRREVLVLGPNDVTTAREDVYHAIRAWLGDRYEECYAASLSDTPLCEAG